MLLTFANFLEYLLYNKQEGTTMANGVSTIQSKKKRVSNRRNGDRKKPKQVPFISFYDLTRDLCGSVDSGVPDLATNKKYMKGYGQRWVLF